MIGCTTNPIREFQIDPAYMGHSQFVKAWLIIPDGLKSYNIKYDPFNQIILGDTLTAAYIEYAKTYFKEIVFIETRDGIDPNNLYLEPAGRFARFYIGGDPCLGIFNSATFQIRTGLKVIRNNNIILDTTNESDLFQVYLPPISNPGRESQNIISNAISQAVGRNFQELENLVIDMNIN